MNRRTQLFKLSRESEKAWADYAAAINAMFPRAEATALLRHARPGHERRWRAIDAAMQRITHRKITEDDIV